MCGRYVTPNDRAMESYFHLGRHNWSAGLNRYNVAPTTQVPIVYSVHGETVGNSARWGLIPTWWKDEVPPSLTFNARSEEAATKPTWRQSMRSARCLMPAKGWYEWNENEPALSLSGRKGRQPYYFHCPGEDVMAIAGLWSLWKSSEGVEVLSCALLTKEAGAANIAKIHHRMPVVLDPSQFDAWLSPEATSTEVTALIANSRTQFNAHPVSTKVNNVRNDSSDLIALALAEFDLEEPRPVTKDLF